MRSRRGRRAAAVFCAAFLLAGIAALPASAAPGQQGGFGTRILREASAEGYLIPNSGTQELTEEDLKGLTAAQLRLARNEIFARHGVMFYHKDVQDYFNGKGWYKGTVWSDQFSMASLSEIEQANVMLIAKYESSYVAPTEDYTGVPLPEGQEYMIPDSASRYLTYMDLVPLSADQLRVARNEIYARHGRTFYDETLQKFFNARSWYKAVYSPDQFPDNLLSEIEYANVILIKNYESGLPETPAATGYILPESSTRYLTAADMAGLSAADMRIARNEIYARHGRIFNSQDLMDRFNSCYWYNPTTPADAFDEKVLSAIEVANIAFIQEYEKNYPDGVPASGNAEVPLTTGYILTDSSTRYLTESDLAGLSATQLRIARNEIYARHGRMFNSQDLQDYFNGCFWYVPTIPADSFDPHTLSNIEYVNIALIEKYEGYLNNPAPSYAVPTPAPVTPAPVTPAPVTPAPVTPAPVTPAPVTPAPATPVIPAPPAVETPVTPVMSDAYDAFLAGKAYTADTGSWSLAAETCARLDINKDGVEELLVQGPAELSWYNTLIYTKTAEGDVVLAGSLYHCMQLQYSESQSALVYHEARPSINMAAYTFGTVTGKSFSPKMVVVKEPKMTKNQVSLHYYVKDSATGAETVLTDAQMKAYIADAAAVTFSPIP